MADLIERASIMRCIEKWLPRDKCGEEELEDSILTDLCVSMLMEIAEQQTIDAVPVVMGTWVVDTGIIGVVQCSRCKTHFSGEYIEHQYCPHCGAKMDDEYEKMGGDADAPGQ